MSEEGAPVGAVVGMGMKHTLTCLLSLRGLWQGAQASSAWESAKKLPLDGGGAC